MGIFDKIKKSLEDKREQAKEDKINSDPKLQEKWEKAQKDAARADKSMDDLLKMYDDDKDDD